MRDLALARPLSRPFPTPLPVGLFHFETPEDGGGGGATTATPEAPASPDATPAAPTAPPTGEATGEATPAAPEAAWVPPREEWERQTYIADLLANELLGQEPGPGDVADVDEQEPGQIVLDPFDDNFGSSLVDVMRQAIDAAVERATAPYQEQRMQEVFQEADQRALDILDSVKQQPGAVEFDSKIARALAREFMPAAEQRWGGRTPRAAEEALTRAAQLLQQNNRAIAEQAVNKYKAELAEAGARPPGALPGRMGIQTVPDARDEVDLARRIAQQPQIRV